MENANGPLLKVIIVEDDLPIKTLVCKVLEHSFVVTAFDDGMDALSYLQKGDLPDIIISDLNTPHLNGYELLSQLKASSYFSSIPVIILSGEEGSETRIKCLEAGADDYILKPFNPRELEVRINVILKRYGKALISKRF
jgi:DNA-binding response OmpR family regulator